MRGLLVILGFFAVLAYSGGQVLAFEQTAPAPVPSESAKEAPPGAGTAPLAPGVGVTPEGAVKAPLAPDPSQGTEHRSLKIPGLGSFDFLPKMDFGLELLYGEPSKADSAVDPLHDQDVTIRGTVKRRF